MGKNSRLIIGLGLASGAVLAAWLFTGTRKEKTRNYIGQKVKTIKNSTQKRKKLHIYDDPDIHYV